MTQHNRRKWIVLAAVAAFLVLCVGGAALGTVLWFVERAKDTPSTVEPGDRFRHDVFVVEEGWQVVEDRGDFDVVDLTVTNRTLRSRAAYLELSIYDDGQEVGIVSCSTPPIGARDSAAMTCFSADSYVDFDEVRVADTF